MKFGMFYLLQSDEPRTPEDERQRFRELMEEVTYAEDMGFEYVWLAEHHFVPDWSYSSTPEVTLTAIGQRTSKMRLGFAVALLPIHHPLRLAAQVATMDILSDGRVDFGAGRSKNLWQLAPFGVGLEEARGRMIESLSIIPRMWTEEVFSHQGEYYQIPPRRVVPRPVQQPHPPMWAACTQEDTSRIAGEMGIGCLLNVMGGLERTGKIISVYKEGIDNAKPVGKFINDRVMISIMVHCDEDNRRALKRGGEIGAWAKNTGGARLSLEWEGVDPSTVPADYQVYLPAGGPKPPEEISPEEFLENGAPYCIGDPDACVKTLDEYEALGVEGVMCNLHQGPTTHQEAMNTIRLFGEHVIPRYQKGEREPATRTASDR